MWRAISKLLCLHIQILLRLVKVWQSYCTNYMVHVLGARYSSVMSNDPIGIQMQSSAWGAKYRCDRKHLRLSTNNLLCLRSSTIHDNLFLSNLNRNSYAPYRTTSLHMTEWPNRSKSPRVLYFGSFFMSLVWLKLGTSNLMMLMVSTSIRMMNYSRMTPTSMTLRKKLEGHSPLS